MTNFTPYIDHTKVTRVLLEVSKADRDAFDSLPVEPHVAPENQKTVRVLDIISQRYYTVRRAACPSNCFCAAELVR